MEELLKQLAKLMPDVYFDKENNAVLQVALQQAIFAKGWEWTLCYDGVNQEYSATVTNGLGNEFDTYSKDNVTEALLASFIAALQA